MVRLAILIVFVATACGCDQLDQALKPPPPVVASVAAPAKPTVTPADLYFSSLEMYKSSKFRTSGDLRPFFIVQGRIHNNSIYTVTSVRLFVQVWTAIPNTGGNGSMKEDSAVLDLKTNILPGETQSFMQECQIAPPSGKWNWQYQALSVEATD